MFNNAQHDRELLDCLDWLDTAGTVTIELPANIHNRATDIRTMLLNHIYEKLEYLTLVIDADISQLDHPMVRVTRWHDSQGMPRLKIETLGDKLKALEKLVKLTGGYKKAPAIVQSCY